MRTMLPETMYNKPDGVPDVTMAMVYDMGSQKLLFCSQGPGLIHDVRIPTVVVVVFDTCQEAYGAQCMMGNSIS